MDIFEKINEGKIRGYLTINKRIIFEGGIYHITQRAPGKELLFLEETDYLRFLKLLKKTVKKFNLEVFCFALLPNHLHLFLRIADTNLSKAMKNLFERYADYFNTKYERKGHVFCGRYRASLCNNESYLLAVSIYIHLNPYNAGLCKAFKDYRWSSLSLYTASTSRETFINFEEILSLLDSQIDNARKKYIKVVEENMKLKGGNLLDPFPIKRFIKEAAKTVRRTVGNDKDLEELDRLVEHFKLKKKTRSIKDKEAKKYLIEQLLSNGYSIKEMMQMLSVGRTTLYRTLNFKE